MSRLRVIPVAVAAAVFAFVGAVPAASAAVPAAPATVTADCAVLGDQGPGWAEIRNACDFDITASVSLSSGRSPACVDIRGGDSRVVYWRGGAVATNASEC